MSRAGNRTGSAKSTLLTAASAVSDTACRTLDHHSTPRRGRPPMGAGMDVPRRLLAALEDALRDTPHADVRLRDIAARAGTSHAMIGYYFVDRDGMLAALVEHMLDAMIVDLYSLRERLRDRPYGATRLLLRCLSDHISRHPEVARLAMSEVARPHSAIGKRVRARHLPRILVACHGIVRDLIDNGTYRADLDRALAVNALTGFATLGHIALPNLPNLDVEAEGFRSERWLDFTVAALDAQFIRVNHPTG